MVKDIIDILKEILEKIWEKGDLKPEQRPDDSPRKPDGSGASIVIQKLADKIEVRDSKDIDEIADKVAEKFLEVAVNMG